MYCPNCKNQKNTILGSYCGKHASFSKLSLANCSECQLVFADPMPADADLGVYYEDYWKGEVATVSASTKRYYLAQCINRIRFLKTQIRFNNGMKILDVGAGPGVFLDALKHEQYRVGYYAIEPDLVQSKALANKDGVSQVYSDIVDVDKELKFDLIILSHVLEHVSNPNVFLHTITNMIKKDGYLYIEVPNQDYLYKSELEPHVLFFNTQSLNYCLKSHGTIIKTESFGKLISNIQSHQSNFRSPSKIESLFKEFVKSIIARLNRNSCEVLIHKMQMPYVGENRQWLRAIVKIQVQIDSNLK